MIYKPVTFRFDSDHDLRPLRRDCTSRKLLLEMDRPTADRLASIASDAGESETDAIASALAVYEFLLSRDAMKSKIYIQGTDGEFDRLEL